MHAGYISNIIINYNDLPYKCILFDGAWGIGKSYAVRTALEKNNNSCIISVYGMNNIQDIYMKIVIHFFNKTSLACMEHLSKVIDSIANCNIQTKQIRDVITSILTWEDLFSIVFSAVNNYKYIVVLDDIERIGDHVSMCELMGIIENLKQYKSIKVILVANVDELSAEILKIYKKYEEKIVEKIYVIDSISDYINWIELNMDAVFVEKFIHKHQINNIRTVIRAQRFFEEVVQMMGGTYVDAFYDSIRSVCYGITVESVDNKYKEQNLAGNSTVAEQVIYEIRNKFVNRVISNYLGDINITKGFVEKLILYWQTSMPIDKKDFEAEYQIFLGLGEKPDFYKNDIEIKLYLYALKKQIKETKDYKQLINYQERYIIWNDILKQDISLEKFYYEYRLYQLMFESVVEGDISCLTFGTTIYNIESEANKTIIERVIKNVECSSIIYFVECLAKCTMGESAAKIARNLLHLLEYIDWKVEKIYYAFDILYHKQSLPIMVIDEEQYYTIRCIMKILKNIDKNRFTTYVNEILLECDRMSRHRIEVALSQIESEVL